MIHKEKYLNKRSQYLDGLDGGVNILEIDALLGGDRLLPPRLTALSRFGRNIWTVLHGGGKPEWRGWGWNPADGIPKIDWSIEEQMEIDIDLSLALQQAYQFNPWEELAG